MRWHHRGQHGPTQPERMSALAAVEEIWSNCFGSASSTIHLSAKEYALLLRHTTGFTMPEFLQLSRYLPASRICKKHNMTFVKVHLGEEIACQLAAIREAEAEATQTTLKRKVSQLQGLHAELRDTKKHMTMMKSAAVAAVDKAKVMAPVRVTAQQARGMFEPVRCLRMPGEGCCAQVWVAKALSLGEPAPHVALKEVPIPRGCAKGCRQTVQALAQEFSTHLCAYKACPDGVVKPIEMLLVHDGHGEPAQGLLVTTLQICDLADYASRHFPQGFPPRECAFIVQQLAVHLQALHQHGVVWLDAKPGNVLISPAGGLVLADFGLSERRVYGCRYEGAGGTPGFEPPEHRSGGDPRFSRKSDAYSLGVLIVWMMKGHIGMPLPSVEGPAELASLIKELTQPSPQARPDMASVISSAFVQAYAPAPGFRLSVQ